LKTNNIIDEIESLSIKLSSIDDSKTKIIIMDLLNLLETLYGDNQQLKAENQQLKDDINHLKGEQGKPDIKGKRKKMSSNHSSEDERKANGKDKGDSEVEKKKKKRNRKSKLSQITVDREQICSIDKSTLPDDAQNKGFTEVVIQDIKIITDNVKYLRETWYSPSLKKTFIAPLPNDVAGKGEFGVGIRSLIPLLKSQCKLSEKCILEFFENFGIVISNAYISNQWTNGYDEFHHEKSDIINAGLASTDYQQIDDTSARVNGSNHYTQILCNPYYSAYFTLPHKDRLTVLDVLRNFAPRTFLYNQEAIDFLEGFNLSAIMRQKVDKYLQKHQVINETSFDALLDYIKPGPQQRTRIKEACAIAAYHAQTEIPVVNILMADDAPQFKLLAHHIALCWVHDGRLYKKLNPIVPQHKQELDEFLTTYWDFYHQLKAYKEAPNEKQAEWLSKRFDTLFSTDTNYQQLNDRIGKTRAKKEAMLMVLEHPELPLHNNASELAARVQARERDVSLHTMSAAGTKAKDTFMTISQTAIKLGVRTYDYIRDRVSGEYKLPSLAQLIREKSDAREVLGLDIPGDL
jgi:hypothetical protein